MMPGAEPFEFLAPHRSTAVLLVHGFTSSAYSMRELGKTLSDSGFDAYGLLLPGHGTTPEDMEKNSWKDWYHAVETAFTTLHGKYRHVVVCGQSMGGCLALHLASFQPVTAVIALSSGLSIGAGPKYVLPWMKPVWRFIRKKNGPDIRDPAAKRQEVHYDRMPVRSIGELQKLLSVLATRLRHVTCPVLLMHARQDHTFPYAGMEEIVKRLGSTDIQTVTLPDSYHVVTLDVDRGTVQKESVAFIRHVLASVEAVHSTTGKEAP